MNCQNIFSVKTHRVIPHGRLWTLSLLHLKVYSMWEYKTPFIRKNISILPLTHYTCILWAEIFPIYYLTYLKSCSKPKWYNHVSVQLGPHIKYGHDEWNHQQLQCLKKTKLPWLSQQHKKLKEVGGAVSEVVCKHGTSLKSFQIAPDCFPIRALDLFKNYWES